MKQRNNIVLFMFIIILVNCSKVGDNKILQNNQIYTPKDIKIAIKDSSKIEFKVNTYDKKNWNGDYSIKTKAVSNSENRQEIDLGYYININGKKAILSIGAEFSEDFWCEGEYYLENKDNCLYATGKCNENDTNDFMLKQSNNHYYIKSKRFKNTDWQLLSKE